MCHSKTLNYQEEALNKMTAASYICKQ